MKKGNNNGNLGKLTETTTPKQLTETTDRNNCTETGPRCTRAAWAQLLDVALCFDRHDAVSDTEPLLASIESAGRSICAASPEGIHLVRDAVHAAGYVTDGDALERYGDRARAHRGGSWADPPPPDASGPLPEPDGQADALDLVGLLIADLATRTAAEGFTTDNSRRMEEPTSLLRQTEHWRAQARREIDPPEEARREAAAAAEAWRRRSFAGPPEKQATASHRQAKHVGEAPQGPALEELIRTAPVALGGVACLAETPPGPCGKQATGLQTQRDGTGQVPACEEHADRVPAAPVDKWQRAYEAQAQQAGGWQVYTPDGKVPQALLSPPCPGCGAGREPLLGWGQLVDLGLACFEAPGLGRRHRHALPEHLGHQLRTGDGARLQLGPSADHAGEHPIAIERIWIPVTERLPGPSQLVLAWLASWEPSRPGAKPAGCFVACRAGPNMGWRDATTDDRLGEVTHWQPLPSPPVPTLSG